MIRPRIMKRYCPSCKKHQEHEAQRTKKKQPSELKWGQRRFRRVMAGYRGFPRPKPEGREKPTRRVNLRYRCSQCKKYHHGTSIRAKRFELKEAH